MFQSFCATFGPMAGNSLPCIDSSTVIYSGNNNNADTDHMCYFWHYIVPDPEQIQNWVAIYLRSNPPFLGKRHSEGKKSYTGLKFFSPWPRQRRRVHMSPTNPVKDSCEPQQKLYTGLKLHLVHPLHRFGSYMKKLQPGGWKKKPEALNRLHHRWIGCINQRRP